MNGFFVKRELQMKIKRFLFLILWNIVGNLTFQTYIARPYISVVVKVNVKQFSVCKLNVYQGITVVEVMQNVIWIEKKIPMT